jgi:ADP-dependent NAD(P)H-hydrate dehydratase
MSTSVDITARLLRQMPLPLPTGEVDKNSRGTLLVVGGSHRVPGAILLSGVAALRAGVGKIQLACPRSLALPLGMALPEAGICALDEDDDGEPSVHEVQQLIESAQQSHAVLIGPGIMSGTAAAAVTRLLLEKVHGPVFVIDARALSGLWENTELLKRHAGRVVLTPHAGEMASLCHREKDQIEADPLAVAVEGAAHCGSVMTLKGAITFIASPLGGVFRYDQGVVGLATAGSGDVLAGILAGLAARGTDPLDAAIWAVFLHAQAGQRLTSTRGALGFLARELPTQIPALLQSFHAAECAS